MVSTTLTALSATLRDRQNLDAASIAFACERLLDEGTALEERANFLRALHEKGETPGEIAGFIQVLLRHAVSPGVHGDCLDVCGTGGDKAGLFNVSTAVMFVATACGARVVKHGNRGVTSPSGGADVLEALGVRLDLDARDSLEAAGCAFLFAPRHHPAFKAVVPVRKFLAAEGTPTIFNIMGPLLNPALPDFQLAGVFSENLLPVYAEVFRLLGRKHAWVVHGGGGLDEVSLLGPTKVLATREGVIRSFSIDPTDFGLPLADLEDLRGGTAPENAALLEDLFSGRQRGPRRDIVTLNTACALVVAGTAPDLPAALAIANAALDEGRAVEVLERLRRLSAKT
jgi:anthranilate phosphoribosyltransferase